MKATERGWQGVCLLAGVQGLHVEGIVGILGGRTQPLQENQDKKRSDSSSHLFLPFSKRQVPLQSQVWP